MSFSKLKSGFLLSFCMLLSTSYTSILRSNYLTADWLLLVRENSEGWTLTDNSHISYVMKPGVTNLTNGRYSCDHSPGSNRNFTKSLQDISNYTSASTNLSIAVVGDSLGFQFFHAFEQSLSTNLTQRNVMDKVRVHEQLTLIEGIRGNGTLGFLRLTSMWDQEHHEHPDYQGRMLVGNSTKNKFDAMVFRIPNGWIEAKEVNHTNLNETIYYAKQVLKVKVVVFVAMFFNNNIDSRERWDELQEGNKRLRDFARQHSDVLVLDMDHFMHGLIERNAKELGFNQSSWLDVALFQRLPGKYNHSVPHVCATPVTHKRCVRNMISMDGMHLCMESIGGRTNAGIACLLGCAFHQEVNQEGCEKECNVMSMRIPTAEEN